MHKIVVILGPTSSGKSSLAVMLARRFKGVIISADSRQVYRGLDIGTGKVTRREMAGVKHYLLSLASPKGQYTVARYSRDFHRTLKAIPAGCPIFLVGGSPFYIKSVIEPYSFSSVPPDLKLRRRLAGWSTNKLFDHLRQLDPLRAKSIDPANRRRLIRAIEIAAPNKKTPPKPIAHQPLSIIKIGIQVPRPELYRRIDTRVDRRIRQGMIKEVARLHRQGVNWTRLDSFGLEYRYISRYLRGQLEQPEMVNALKGAIHDFSRRQMTWWRKEKDIHWINKSTQATSLVSRWLAN